MATNLRQHLHNDLALVVEGETDDDKEPLDAVSPTSVVTEAKEDGTANHPWHGLIRGVETIQTHVQNGMVQVQKTSQELSSSIVVDRKSITVSVLSTLLTLLVLGGMTLCFLGAVAILTSPLWLPIAVVTSPVWLPLLIVSSPIWLTLVLVGGMTIVCSAGTLLSTFFFFAWPQEWLPTDSKWAASYLYYRNQATKWLVKWQAKLVLYAAGVGPLADAAFCVLDRIDLEQLGRELQDLDVREVTESLKRMDVGALQASLMKILKSVLR